MPTPMTLHPQATVRSQQMLPRNHRAPKWADVPDEQWYDWKWQLKNRINSVEELEEVIRLTESERAGASAKGIFRLDITPYFASLMDPEDPTCPVRRQLVSTRGRSRPPSPGTQSEPDARSRKPSCRVGSRGSSSAESGLVPGRREIGALPPPRSAPSWSASRCPLQWQ